MNVSTTDRYLVHCTQCGKATYHDIRGSCRRSEVSSLDDNSEIEFSDSYALLQCLVCGQAQVREQAWNSENEFSEPRLFGPPAPQALPKWAIALQEQYRSILEEVYVARSINLQALPMMGIRAILDTWVTHHAIEGRTFEEKLKSLCNLGYISASDVEVFEPVFDAGSAAAHRSYRPSPQDIDTALNAVELLLQRHELPASISRLKENTPLRR